MNPAIPIVFGAFLAGGSVSEQQREYASWAATPTPKSWRLGPTWAFVLVDKKGEILGSMTVRFTDQKADSCLDGNWNRVETIRQQGSGTGSWWRAFSVATCSHYLEPTS